MSLRLTDIELKAIHEIIDMAKEKISTLVPEYPDVPKQLDELEQKIVKINEQQNYTGVKQ